MATIGSSTAPSLSLKAGRCMAAGSATDRPRPMNASRLVSYEVEPTDAPWMVIRWIIQGGRSPPERGRRVQRIACALAQ